MSLGEVVALLPLISVAVGAVIVLLLTAFWRNHASIFSVVLLTLILAAVALLPLEPRRVTPLLIIDRFSRLMMGLLFLNAFVVALLSRGYLLKAERPGEYYLLLLLATAGCAVLSAANHFASFFIGLEILSVSLYGMIAYLRHRRLAIEASLKYLVLAGGSSAFLLFGAATLYLAAGTMDFSALAPALGERGGLFPLVGGLLVFVGIGFKLALVPFHTWTPEIYDGAPAPVTAFIATASKGAVLALLIRFGAASNILSNDAVYLTLTVVAILSMFVGNLLALYQRNLKRLLAYSSIAHLGYILVALLSGSSAAVVFYLVTYLITTLAAFGVVTLVSDPAVEADRSAIDDYRGFFWRRPGSAAVLTGALLSLAGIPLTAGFIGKFYVIATGVGASRWILVAALILNSALSIYYYLRVLLSMLSPVDKFAPASLPERRPSPSSAIALAAVSLGVVAIGIYPAPMLKAIQVAVTGFSP